MTEADLGPYFAARLAETAEQLAKSETLDAREIATALISTGITVVRNTYGPAAATAWLRELAFEYEANDRERVN